MLSAMFCQNCEIRTRLPQKYQMHQWTMLCHRNRTSLIHWRQPAHSQRRCITFGISQCYPSTIALDGSKCSLGALHLLHIHSLLTRSAAVSAITEISPCYYSNMVLV